MSSRRTCTRTIYVRMQVCRSSHGYRIVSASCALRASFRLFWPGLVPFMCARWVARWLSLHVRSHRVLGGALRRLPPLLPVRLLRAYLLALVLHMCLRLPMLLLHSRAAAAATASIRLVVHRRRRPRRRIRPFLACAAASSCAPPASSPSVSCVVCACALASACSPACVARACPHSFPNRWLAAHATTLQTPASAFLAAAHSLARACAVRRAAGGMRRSTPTVESSVSL